MEASVTAPDELQHALLDRREDDVLACAVAERDLLAAYDHKVGHVAEALAKLADSFSSERLSTGQRCLERGLPAKRSGKRVTNVSNLWIRDSQLSVVEEATCGRSSAPAIEGAVVSRLAGAPV